MRFNGTNSEVQPGKQRGTFNLLIKVKNYRAILNRFFEIFGYLSRQLEDKFLCPITWILQQRLKPVGADYFYSYSKVRFNEEISLANNQIFLT